MRDHDGPPRHPPTFDADAAWTRLKAAHDLRAQELRAREGDTREDGSTVGRYRHRILFSETLRGRGARWWLSAAPVAAAWVFVAAGLFWLSGSHQSTAIPFREFTSAPGGRSTITLRDGTRIVLAAGTRLRVPADFGVGDRTVELDGEAVFSVVHDTSHPFAVHTERAVVRDVGTQFDIRAYRGDAVSRVAVAEGEVSVEEGLAKQALRPGDREDITASGVVVTHRADVAALMSWVQGGLVFNDTPLRDAIREVARRFDLSITVADSTLLNKPITASFTSTTPDEVLDVVTFTVGARFERHGRTVVIRRRTSPVVVPPVRGRGPAPVRTAARASTSNA